MVWLENMIRKKETLDGVILDMMEQFFEVICKWAALLFVEGMAKTWYNLGKILEDQGKIEGIILNGMLKYILPIT